MAPLNLEGIHHLTAISANAPANLTFYTQVLGMRLVKKTVNQDDTRAYHLFYADKVASPGTDLTFFDWSQMSPERRGTRSISRTSLRVAGEGTLEWWVKRLDTHHVAHGSIIERDGRQVLDVEDGEGQRLTLVDDGGWSEAHPWERSPVPAEYQIRGLGPIHLSIPVLRPTDVVLTKVMHMQADRTYPHPENPKHTVHVYAMGAGGPGAELHVAVQPDLSPARQGAGGVHHVAFRTPNYDEHAAWVDHITEAGIPNTGKVERYYFRSLYFREPNGILFEIATDGPGFAVDEPAERLGERLALPPFLEPKREEIERHLQPLPEILPSGELSR